MNLKGVIFDMDGTIVDVPYDWDRIKSELMTRGKPILSHIESLKEPERSEKWKTLERYEDKATQKAELKQGMREFINFLDSKGVKKALVSNNSRKNVSFLLHKFHLKFDCVITRESGLWKPSGAPILAALKKIGLSQDESCVVGDSHFDIKAASEAGIEKIFIISEEKEKFISKEIEVVHSVLALKTKIEKLL